MSRQLKIVVSVNIVIVVLFCWFNWANWSLLNDERAGLPISSKWGPVWIHVQPKTNMLVSEPNQMPDFTSVLFPNYPLMLFLLSTTLNLYFIMKLHKTKQSVTFPE